MDSPLTLTIGARMSAYLVTANDYKKQRKRLNKKLLKLRRELNLVTQDTKNYRTKQQQSHITKDQMESDDRYKLLYLYLSERDLLYALELKNMMDIETTHTSSTLIKTKLKRSLQHSYKLLQLNNFNKIECYVYSSLIAGQLSTIGKKWNHALNSFSIAKCLLDYLNSVENDEFKTTLYNDILETLVDPSLRLSLSQLDLSGDLKSISRKYCHGSYFPNLTPGLDLIDASFTNDISSNVELEKQVEWRDHEALIYNDELAYKIMEINKQQWHDYDANQFDLLITGWTQILELHQFDTEKNQDEDDLEQVQNRAILLTYINYNLLFTKLKRDLILYTELKDQKDIIRLFNGIITIVEQLKELPGVYNDDDLLDSLNSLSQFFQSKKNVVIAECYQINGKYSESLKIYKYILDNYNLHYKTKFPYDITNNEEIAIFKSQLTNKLLQNQINSQFELSKGFESYTIENLNKYPNGPIFNLEKLQPIMCKPVLFDIGYNYITYDVVNRKPIESEKKGFFGLFK